MLDTSKVFADTLWLSKKFPKKIPPFILAALTLGKFSFKFIKPVPLQSRALLILFLKPNFKYSVGKNNLVGSTTAGCYTGTHALATVSCRSDYFDLYCSTHKTQLQYEK